MSNTIRFLLWLILLLLLGWLWLGPWYPCWQEVLCADCLAAAKANASVTQVDSLQEKTKTPPNLPVYYDWNLPTALQGTGFDPFRDSIRARLEAGDQLKVTGFYYDGEEKPADTESLGLARAQSWLSLLGLDEFADQVEFRARDYEDATGKEGQFFGATELAWTAAAEVDEEETTEPEKVEELKDRTYIRFPFKSTDRIKDPTIEEYMQKLANRVKQTQEEIRLTGHADNIGTPERNMEWGMNRANSIRDLLIDLGVSSDQITVESKGDQDPAASNSTEAGRAQNRRVEVRLIKTNS
jgi:OOP family OmpA-OmpF porin